MAYFHYTNNATQVMAVGSGDDVDFQTAISDADSVVSGSIFTVPAGWDGLCMNLSAGVQANDFNRRTGGLYLLRSTDGGSNWFSIGIQFASTVGWQVSTPVLLTTGHKYKVHWFSSVAQTLGNLDQVFFSGHDVPYAFRVERLLATQSLTGGVESVLDADTRIFDTTGDLFDLEANVFRVPAWLDGALAFFSGGTRFTANNNHEVHIKRGGVVSPDETLFRSSNGALTANFTGCAGPFRLATGEEYYFVVRPEANTTLDNVQTTFFSGWISPFTAPAVPARVGFAAENPTSGLQATTTAAFAEFDTVEFDTYSGVDTTNFWYKVPPELHGARMAFSVTVGCGANTAQSLRTRLMRSQTGGATWEEVGASSPEGVSSATYVKANIAAGPFELATGEIFAIEIEAASGTLDIDLVRFSGWVA